MGSLREVVEGLFRVGHSFLAPLALRSSDSTLVWCRLFALQATEHAPRKVKADYKAGPLCPHSWL